MAYKGSGIVFARELAERAAKRELVESLLEGDNRSVYANTLPVTMVPVDQAAAIFAATAQALYPGDAEGFRKIGMAMARDHLNSLYRIILKISTIPYIIKQTAKLWHIYYTDGKPHSEPHAKEKRVDLVIEEFAHMPEPNREVTAGWVTAGIQIGGAKDVVVKADYSNSAAWRWEITWR